MDLAASGAREPRGVVDATLVPQDAQVGEVLRADADFDLDGVTIVGLAPITEKKRNEAERIELITTAQRDDQLVTSSLVKGGRSDRGERRERRPRGDKPDQRDPDRQARQARPRQARRPQQAAVRT